MTTGIVLAAGEATRFPNKLLLPIAHDRIVIESAINWLKAVTKHITVVVPLGDVLREVLTARGHDLHYVTQPVARGVPDAIQLCAGYVRDHALVTFGDNVYDWETVRAYETYGTVRKYEHDADMDGWCGPYGWVERGHPDKTLTFAGHMLLSRWQMEQADETQSTVRFMNEIKLCHELSESRWYDLGTPERYLRYVREEMS